MDEPTPAGEPGAAPVPAARPRRWPLGALTLAVVVFVVGGVLILGGDDTPTTPTILPTTSPTMIPMPSGDVIASWSVSRLTGTPVFAIANSGTMT